MDHLRLLLFLGLLSLLFWMISIPKHPSTLLLLYCSPAGRDCFSGADTGSFREGRSVHYRHLGTLLDSPKKRPLSLQLPSFQSIFSSSSSPTISPSSAITHSHVSSSPSSRPPSNPWSCTDLFPPQLASTFPTGFVSFHSDRSSVSL